MSDGFLNKFISRKRSIILSTLYYIISILLTYTVSQVQFADYGHKAFLGSILYGFLILSPIFLGLAGTIFSMCIFIASIVVLFKFIYLNGVDNHQTTIIFYHIAGLVVTFIIHLLYSTIKTYNSKLFSQGYTDFLTSLFNRRYFDMKLRLVLKDVNRHRSSLSLLLFDIDYFKKINDTYGHDIGDEILKRVGEVLNSSLRSIDVPCRIGGDEFAVILPNIEVTQVEDITLRVQQHIEGVNSESSRLPNFTISIGVATTNGDPFDIKNLFKMADKALYASKVEGRNRATYCTLNSDI